MLKQNFYVNSKVLADTLLTLLSDKYETPKEHELEVEIPTAINYFMEINKLKIDNIEFITNKSTDCLRIINGKTRSERISNIIHSILETIEKEAKC